MHTRRVHSIMTPHPKVLQEGDAVTAAIEAMVAGGFRHLPVVRQGVLVGIVSDQDLVGPTAREHEPEALLRQGRFGQLRLADVMTRRPISVSPEDPLADAVALMVEHHLGAVPVVDSGMHPVGMVSLVDVASAYVSENPTT